MIKKITKPFLFFCDIYLNLVLSKLFKKANNIKKTRIFNKMINEIKGHKRSHKGILFLKMNFFFVNVLDKITTVT